MSETQQNNKDGGDNVAGDKIVHEHYHSPQEQPQTPIRIRYDISRLPLTSNPKLYGREQPLKLLNQAWKKPKTKVVILVAMGGTGKTALLKHWLDKLLQKKSAPESAFAYSFYSQGAAEDKQTDAEEFFSKAFAHFGYHEALPKNQHDKGVLLAQWVGAQRALLVLDGLEPLQHPQGVMRGALKDKGLVSLLEQLALKNQGLCLISSRQPVTELKGKAAVIEHDLAQLSATDGVRLLKAFKLTGSEKDFSETVAWLGGHALALNLLGHYVRATFAGDLRQRDKLSAFSDSPEEGAHAEKIIAAYERHLKGTADLALLSLLGLFDRPVSQAAFTALLAPSEKHKDKQRLALTAPIRKLSATDYGALIQRLRDQHLLNAHNPEHPDSLDCHPLLREYFGKRLQTEQPKAWQQAQRQLYDYYKAVPEKELPDTLAEMEPLFAAVAHGCAAGLHQQALEKVYWPRILRENEHYVLHKLGAFATDLAVVAHFFSQPWNSPAAALPDEYKAFVLNWAAFRLRALGRLSEAAAPMQAGIDLSAAQENWIEAAKNANNLSELHNSLGALVAALSVAEQGVAFADKSGDDFQRMVNRSSLADAQQHSGAWAAAAASFAEAEEIQKQWQPESPQLYSLPGFRYCDYLLSLGDWQQVQGRAQTTLKYQHEGWYSLLSIALDQLSLGRASLQQACIESVGWQQANHSSAEPQDSPHSPAPDLMLTRKDSPALNVSSAHDWLELAVDDFHKAGTEHHLPRALLARCACARFAHDWQRAHADLAQVFESARRSDMRLHLCDAHFEAARLALMGAAFDDLLAAAHLDKAAELIEATGYKRRLLDLHYLRAYTG